MLRVCNSPERLGLGVVCLVMSLVFGKAFETDFILYSPAAAKLACAPFYERLAVIFAYLEPAWG